MWSAILAGAEYPIHTLRRRIVATDDFIGLGREIEPAAGKIQSVHGMQRAEIDGRQRLARDQVDNRDRVKSAVEPMPLPVGDEREAPVIRGDDLVRIRSGWKLSENLKRRGVDDGDGVLVFRQREDRRVLRRRNACRAAPLPTSQRSTPIISFCSCVPPAAE